MSVIPYVVPCYPKMSCKCVANAKVFLCTSWSTCTTQCHAATTLFSTAIERIDIILFWSPLSTHLFVMPHGFLHTTIGIPLIDGQQWDHINTADLNKQMHTTIRIPLIDDQQWDHVNTADLNKQMVQTTCGTIATTVYFTVIPPTICTYMDVLCTPTFWSRFQSHI